MEDLPSVSAFEIKKNLNNSQERFYGKNAIPGEADNENVIVKINKIFASKNFVYKCKCRIFLTNDIKECIIVGRNNNYLLTITGEKIKINDIKNIEKL